MGRPKPLSERPTLREIRNKLTAKQLAYAEALASGGLTKIEAYKKAYNIDPNRPKNSISRDATVVSQNPKINIAVDVIREAYSRPELRDAASTRAFVLDGLRREALGEGPDSNAASRIAALTALGKSSHVGLFVDRKEVVHRQAGPDTAADVLQRLQAIAAQVAASREAERQVIDVTPEPARLPEPADSDLPDGE